MRESRSVSFNGISVMVDAVMNVYRSVSLEKTTQLSEALKTNNIATVR